MATQSPPTEVDAVDGAEQARLAMDYAQVGALLVDIPNYTVEEILVLNELQQNNFFRALRIKVSILSSEFSRQPLACLAIPHLKQTLALLEYYYASPELRTLANQIEQDPHQQEYIMLAEMWRDIASYCLKVAALTNNEQLLREAQFAFSTAAAMSSPETNVHVLARFEALIALFKTNERAVTLRELEDLWRVIVDRTDNHDRVAKISWEMMQVAHKLHNSVLEKEARSMCRKHAGYLPGGFMKYAARQIVRTKIIMPLQHATYRGNGDELQSAKLTQMLAG